jgi:peptidoglycan L-alanyl-D-glutamate endopeptidase CwlK
MPSFGKRSKLILKDVHPDIVSVLEDVIKYIDFSVISGHRGQVEQTGIFLAGKSKTPWPMSKHNSMPAEAVDLAPYPINWEKPNRFIYLAGHIMAAARNRGIVLRWGGDWAMSHMNNYQTFNDWGHFEKYQMQASVDDSRT